MRSAKTSIVQARIDPKLKKKGDTILKQLGISASQAINAMYAQIVLQKGLPFGLKIPNKVTQEAMHELESGGGESFTSFNDMVEGIDD